MKAVVRDQNQYGIPTTIQDDEGRLWEVVHDDGGKRFAVETDESMVPLAGEARLARERDLDEVDLTQIPTDAVVSEHFDAEVEECEEGDVFTGSSGRGFWRGPMHITRRERSFVVEEGRWVEFEDDSQG